MAMLDITSDAQGLSEVDRAIIRRTAFCDMNYAFQVPVRQYDQSFWNNFQEAFHTDIISNLGTLRKLPLEIVFAIIREMDVETCFSLRQVNRLARQIVSNSQEYHELATYALPFLSKVMRLDVGKYFSMAHAHHLVRHSGCANCGKVANTVYLLRLGRYCFRCAPLHPVSVSALAKGIRMSPQKIRRLVPSIRIEHFNQRIRLLSLEEALLRLDKHLKVEVDQDELSDRLPSNHRSPSMPVAFLESTGHRQFGYICRGCRDSPARIYTTEEFLKHFQSCDRAKRIWDRRHGELGSGSSH